MLAQILGMIPCPVSGLKITSSFWHGVANIWQLMCASLVESATNFGRAIDGLLVDIVLLISGSIYPLILRASLNPCAQGN